MIQLPIRGRDELYIVHPSKIIGLGMNYRAHIDESDKLKVTGVTPEVPFEPILFAKTPNVLVGPGEAIVLPRLLRDYKFERLRVDYEAELAFIVKTKCKNVPKEEAFHQILGFTCMNDVSERNIQSMEKAGWYRGKSFDTFGPIGPCVVLTEDIPDPQNLNIVCRLNGAVVQSSNTRYMIFPLSEIVAFVSRNMTLLPGDIITTGTPAGVSAMKHGDRVEVEIEGIGVLQNPVVEEE